MSELQRKQRTNIILNVHLTHKKYLVIQTEECTKALFIRILMKNIELDRHS